MARLNWETFRNAVGRERSVGLLLSGATLLFLYAGMFKTRVPFPVDWTLTMLGLALLLALWSYRPDAAKLLPIAPTISFAVLILYLAARLVPFNWDGFGAQKLLESTFLGFPALFLGYHIGRSERTLHSLARISLILALAVSIFVSVVAVLIDNIVSTNGFLDGGYQLTGAFVAGSLLLALPLLFSNRWGLVAVSMALSVVGLAFVGSVPSFVFLFLAYGLVIIGGVFWRETRALAARSLVVAGVAIAVLMLLSAVFQPPAALYRLVWKAQVALEQSNLELPFLSEWFLDKEWNPSSSAEIFQSVFGGKVNLLPVEERENYVDRVDLAVEAFRGFLSAPWFGHGFGAFSYRGVLTEHNIILEMGYEGGVIAVLLFLAFLLSCTVPLIQKMRDTRAEEVVVGLSLAGFFVLSLASQLVGGYFIGRVLMFSLGLLVGFAIRKKGYETQ